MSDDSTGADSNGADLTGTDSTDANPTGGDSNGADSTGACVCKTHIWVSFCRAGKMAVSCHFLASQDALEVMRVTESLTESLTEWALALTLLM